MRVARVGTMDGLAIVSESFLSEPFWIAATHGSLCPGVSVRVQRHTVKASGAGTRWWPPRRAPVPGGNDSVGFQRWGRCGSGVEGAVLAGAQPALLSCVAFEFHDLLHHALPGPSHGFGIANDKVSAGDLSIDDWLPLCLVSGVQQSQSDRSVAGLEALAFFSELVEQIIDPALAPINAISLVDNSNHERNDAEIRELALRCSWRVLVSSGRVVAEQLV